MTDEKILKNAVEKAVKGGWKKSKAIAALCFIPGGLPKNDMVADGTYIRTKSYYRMIFSHDFAKALWGEEDYTDGKIVIANLKAWQYHLQLMVLEEKPLKYLERFL